MIMTFSDYAKSVGKSKVYIHKLYKQGRLKKALVRDQKTGKIMVNQKIADRITGLLKTTQNENKENFNEEFESLSLDQSRHKKIFYEAQQEQAKYEEYIEKLIPAEKVHKQAFTSALLLRDKMLLIPTQVAPKIIGKTSLFEIKNILSECITSVLESISNINAENYSQMEIE